MSTIVWEDVSRIADAVDTKKLRGKSVLLTGSNGLFGRYIATLIAYLNKEHDYKTTLYCVSLHGPSADIAKLVKQDKCIKTLRKDLSKPFTFSHKVDYIFHAACYAQPQKFMENKFQTIELNVNTTRRLLEIAKKNSARFLFFSSAEVYGEIPKNLVPVPETYYGNISTWGVRSIYGESKRLGETICSMFKEDGVGVVAARISHTYGPGISSKDKRVLGEFIRKAKQEKQITLMDEGRAVKTWGYVGDIVQMMVTVLLHGTELIYNIGGAHSVSIKELAVAVAKEVNVPVVVPKKAAGKKHIATDPQIVKLDISRYEKEFGRMKFLPFQEGVRRTLEWDARSG